MLFRSLVSNQMKRQAVAAQAEVVKGWTSPVKVAGAIGDGKTWRAAMASLVWKDAEVMVVGSSGLGPILRVFLGSNSGKIVYNAPVPCIILPRGGEAEAA